MKTKFYAKGDVVYFRCPYTFRKSHYIITNGFIDSPKENWDMLKNIKPKDKKLLVEKVGVICGDIETFNSYVCDIFDDKVYTPILNKSSVIGRSFDCITILPREKGCYDEEWLNMVIGTRIDRPLWNQIKSNQIKSNKNGNIWKQTHFT